MHDGVQTARRGGRPSHVRRGAVLTGLVAAISLIGLLTAAYAAPPANDRFDAAEPIAGETGSRSGTNVEATRESGEPTHAGGPSGRSVWYRWTAPLTGQFEFDTCGSSFDTLLAVYTGVSVAGLAPVAANDDRCQDQSRVGFAATAGTTYSIAVDGFDGETGSFVLSWRLLRPPMNDSFAAAQAISGPVGSVGATTRGATTEQGEPDHARASSVASVWYSWTAPFGGGVGFETCGSQFDTILAAYTGETLSALRQLAANDDRCRLQSRIRFRVTAGQTVRIAVDGAEDSGEFILSWRLAPRPSNDDVAAARRLRGTRGSVRASNAGAVAESREPPHAGSAAGASMWYRWRAPRTMGIFFETCSSATFDTLIAVYRGRPVRSRGRVDQNDDACAEDRSRVIFVARKGVEYLVAVDGFDAQTGQFTLRWGRPGPFAEPCRVPDVRGLTLAPARRALERANCALGRVVFVSSSIAPRGRIVSQFPPPGVRRPFLSRVNIEVSRGPRG